MEVTVRYAFHIPQKPHPFHWTLQVSEGCREFRKMPAVIGLDAEPLKLHAQALAFRG